jgi:ADP-ribosylglycohydrolase
MPGWASLTSLIETEAVQLVEEGIVPAAAEAAKREASHRMSAGADEFEVWVAFRDLPRRSDFGFDEPSDLASIRAKRKATPSSLPRFNPGDVLFDKMYGAWLGRCVGCALGKPVENFMGRHNGMLSWQRQKAYLTAISQDEWPLRNYFPQHSPAEEQTGRVACHQSTREQIAFMETDDDIRYTVLGQIILDKYGRDFASCHVAHEWIDKLGYQQVCTAETQAYRNMVMRCDAFRNGRALQDPTTSSKLDETTDWRFVTHHLNPYREWIGAQIRIDSYGYAAAGNPELAAEMAWRDARISHVKNGIYGAMFCSAMIAAAFATQDSMQIVEAGLAQIPSTSRLYSEMRQTVDICHRYDFAFEKFEDVIHDVYGLLDHYHPVHTNNNAAICVAAVLLAKGDFEKGVTLAVMGGWDSDCNGATVGSIVGAMTGASRAPKHWTAPLNDTLRSSIADYHPIAISECAKRAVGNWKRVNA